LGRALGGAPVIDFAVQRLATTKPAFQIIETQLPPFFLAYAGVKSVSRAANWEFSIGSGLEDWEQASGV